MLDVHHKGRAVVSSGSREEMERDVQAMHGYGLWATLTAGPELSELHPHGRTTSKAAPRRRRGRRARRGRDLHPPLPRRPAAGADRPGPSRARRRRRPARRALRRGPERAARPTRPWPGSSPTPTAAPTGRRRPRRRRSSAAHSAEFRRFTENDLRARKREDALAVVRTLDALAAAGDGGGRAQADRRRVPRTGSAPSTTCGWPSAPGWTSPTRTRTSDLLYRLPDEDPRKPMVMAYLWLGGLQETLVETLMP